jgi:hypothetical protein
LSNGLFKKRLAIFCSASSSSLGLRPAFLARASQLPVSRTRASNRVIALMLTRISLAILA